MSRSDAQIQQEVIAALHAEPMVDPTHIGVEVRQSVVTLSGHVDSFGEKWHAEQAAQSVHSVKALAVEILVNQAGPFQRTDADIARAVKNVLDWNVFIPNNSIKVMVENGWVSLSGEVDADYQRRLAHSTIRYLNGVIGISNHLTVKPTVQGSILKTDIEAMLQRRASREARGIGIAIDNHTVTLTGKVDSLAERNLVSRVVWDFPGVWQVQNQIEIAA